MGNFGVIARKKDRQSVPPEADDCVKKNDVPEVVIQAVPVPEMVEMLENIPTADTLLTGDDILAANRRKEQESKRREEVARLKRLAREQEFAKECERSMIKWADEQLDVQIKLVHEKGDEAVHLWYPKCSDERCSRCRSRGIGEQWYMYDKSYGTCVPRTNQWLDVISERARLRRLLLMEIDRFDKVLTLFPYPFSYERGLKTWTDDIKAELKVHWYGRKTYEVSIKTKYHVRGYGTVFKHSRGKEYEARNGSWYGLPDRCIGDPCEVIAQAIREHYGAMGIKMDNGIVATAEDDGNSVQVRYTLARGLVY